MANDFRIVGYPPSLTDPLTRAVDGASVRSDIADLPFKPRAIHVSVAGNVTFTVGGFTATEFWEQGWHPVRIDRLHLTGTAATVMLWD